MHHGIQHWAFFHNYAPFFKKENYKCMLDFVPFVLLFKIAQNLFGRKFGWQLLGKIFNE